jgi:hypothetical protein
VTKHSPYTIIGEFLCTAYKSTVQTAQAMSQSGLWGWPEIAGKVWQEPTDASEETKFHPQSTSYDL